jgi:cysteine desulfurase/selenocysteine lyase
MFDTLELKKLFPIYTKNPNLVYLDSGATSLKPKVVIDKMNEYYFNYGVNIHRGVYELSYQATNEYEKAREKVANFINANFEEIIFTSSTTDSLNKLALMLSANLKAGDVVLTTELEHHSSVLPWMNIAKQKSAHLAYVPLNEEGRITVESFRKSMNSKVKIVALTYVSNVLGYITPLKEIIEIAHSYNAIVIVDAAQAVSHMRVDVKDLDCDFLAFSGHKMFGPTGVGILYGKANILKKLQPAFYGGDMNELVTKNSVEVKDIPFRFEAGTPMIAEVIGLGRAIDFIEELGFENIEKHNKALHQYLLKQIAGIKELEIYNKNADIAILSFNIKGVHPHDAATCYDQEGIGLRAGHHCAQLVTRWLHCVGTLRASFHIYNDFGDVDKFVQATKNTISLFKHLEEGLYE